MLIIVMKTMRSFCLLLVMVLLALVSVPAGQAGDDVKGRPFLDWKLQRPLQFSDFRGQPDHPHLAALTATAIETSYEIKGQQFKAKVHARFFPEESWMKGYARNERILAHEQLHFDITEWHARKMRKTLQEGKFKAGDNARLQKVIHEHFERWQSDQKAYDAETNHGLNREAQARWEKKVRKGLEQLKKYAY